MSTISDGTTTVTPYLVLGYEAGQAGQSVFHDVIGRRDPDVTLRAPALRAGRLEYFFLTAADAEACRQLHSSAAVFTYSPDDLPDTAMTYAVDDGGITTKLDGDTRRRWTVTVAYREVTP